MKISIVTPSFNQGEFIERTIQSVVSQSFTDREFIIIDGGSTDQSLEIINKFDADITYWVSEADNGQTHAVNKGFSIASGDILGWLNSDDVFYPGTLQKVADHFSTNPDCDVLYGMADYIDDQDNFIRAYKTRNWSFAELKKWCFICQPAVFFRRSVFEEQGQLDESLNYCMDYEYWLRCGQTKPFHYLKDKLAASRLYPENKTIGSRPAVLKEAMEMLFNKFGGIPRRWLGEYSLDLVGYERGFHPTGFERIAWTFHALRKWHKLNYRYNRGVLPLVPLQMLVRLPVIPRRTF